MITPNPPSIHLFATDLDGTLLDGGGPAASFTRTWQTLPATGRPVLVYNTGRSVEDTRELIATRWLPSADAIIGAVGTELWVRHDPRATRDFRAHIGDGWNRPAVEQIVAALPGVARQPAEHQHAHKSSWHWSAATAVQLAGLGRLLAVAGLEATVAYSSNRDLDVLPARGGKGRALAWLCRRLGMPPPRVLVAGDSGNDCAMFLLPEARGIVVRNAHSDLRRAVARRWVFRARSPASAGVIEGLTHFGVLA